MSNFISRIPYYTTGDRYNELQDYDSNSRKKIVKLGSLVVIPTLLWFITGYLITACLLQTSTTIAIITAFTVAFVIFIFERSIVQSKKIKPLLIISRFILGICIAVVSSAILDLVIFKNDIQHYAIQQELAQQQARVDEAQVRVTKSQQDFIAETEGSSGTGQIGYGEVAKVKQNIYQKNVQDYENQRNKLAEMKASLSHPQSEEYNILLAQTGTHTVLTRIKLLHDFVFQNIMALISWLLLLAIGTLLELYCIFTKIWSHPTAYELDNEAREKLLGFKREQMLENGEVYAKLERDDLANYRPQNNNSRTMLN